MQKIIKFLFFILIPLIGISQNKDSLDYQKFSFGIKTGFNYSKIRSNNIEFIYKAKPIIGFYGKLHIDNNFYIKSSFLYSLKGSNSNYPNLNIENHYLDFTILPQYELTNNLLIHTGISYSNLLYSYNIIYNINRWNGKEKFEIDVFDSEINFPIGLELKFQNNVNIEFNYNISTFNINNFQLSINILLNNKNRKKNKNENYNDIKHKVSEQQIKQLRDGTLLVRLKTSQNKIDALKSRGYIEKANKIENKLNIENKKIISAFNENFSFCKTAFFYSSSSKNILNGNFDNIFLDNNLMIDSSIKIDKNKPYFIAEFTTLEQDTAKYFSHYSYDPDGDFNLKKVSNFYKSSDYNIFALVIKDKNFIQLNKPFPYYKKVFYINRTKKCFTKVASINTKLFLYYYNVKNIQIK